MRAQSAFARILLVAGLALAPELVHAESGPADAAGAKGDLDASRVQHELDQLARWVVHQKGELTAYFAELESGSVLAAHDEGRALNPASNAKVPTTAAALAALGPDFRYSSGVYGVVKDGVATRLVLRSNGDPSLGARDLEKLAKKLADAGLKRVTGDVLVDQSAFDDKWVPPAFEQQPHEWAAFRAPVSAVAVERNAFAIRVEPGSVGEKAKISADPAGYVVVENEVDTVRAGQGKKIRAEMQPHGSALGVKVSGQIAADVKSTSFERRVDDPSLYAGYVLRAKLKALGVSVDGGVREGGKDETHPLAEQKSAPLGMLVRELGKNSDNFYAETLLKTLGAKATGHAGTSADGAAAVTDWMKQAGAFEPGTRVVNGSGLFDANRLSARSLVETLRAAHRDANSEKAFVDQLAVGGVDGTLRNRFKSHAARRSVRAKTGTLARAHSLSGYVLGAAGKPSLAFALVINGIAGKADLQRKKMDRVVERAAALVTR